MDKRKRAFIEAINKVEPEHGFTLGYYQPPIQMKLTPIRPAKVTAA